jgi:hypothetical protein
LGTDRNVLRLNICFVGPAGLEPATNE